MAVRKKASNSMQLKMLQELIDSSLLLKNGLNVQMQLVLLLNPVGMEARTPIRILRITNAESKHILKA